MSSYIHDVLRRWSKEANWPYLSSILLVNKNVPLFEEKYGKHDYIWMLEITKDRKCKEIDPVVIRYVDGNNLSLNPEYRLRDWEMVLNVMKEDNNISGIKRVTGTRARYFYKLGRYKEARKYFLKSSLSIKNIGYYITSYIPSLARVIVKYFNVFG